MNEAKERALRDLLGLVVHALDIPHAEHRVNDMDAYDLLRERAARVRAILTDLLGGVLDYTAIQSEGYVLGHQIEDLPVDYDPAEPVAVPSGDDEDARDYYPISYLACGDQVQDAALIETGTPMTCARHGRTYVISLEQWLTEHPAEPSAVPR